MVDDNSNGTVITAAELLQRCHDAIGHQPEDPGDPDSLIGFFQAFRPSGEGLSGFFDDLPGGAGMGENLQRLYDVAGPDSRSDGNRDVYFLVRRRRPLSADRACQLAEQWLCGLLGLAEQTGDEVVINALCPLPSIRVLQGKPPKPPKDPINQSSLMKVFRDSVTGLVDRIPMTHDLTDALRPAFYFVSCDASLRDYLMWPLYAAGRKDVADGQNPYAPYFELWRHGVKIRLIKDRTIDLYLPHD